MRKVSRMLLGPLSIMLAASLWGVDLAFLRPMLYHLQVPLVVFLEHAVAFSFMGFLLYRERHELKKIGPAEWWSLLWIAVFGGAIGTMAITKALFYVNFSQISVIVILQKLQPLFAILLSVWMLRERLSRRFYCWAATALVGSYLITFGFSMPEIEGNRLPFAALLSILAAFSFGTSTAFGKRVTNAVNYRVATYLRFGITALLMFFVISGMAFLSQNGLGLARVTPRDLLVFALIALTTGGVAIFIYYFGLERVKASHATIYELAFPLTAVVLQYVLHRTFMSPGQWLGAFMIILAMTRITQERR